MMSSPDAQGYTILSASGGVYAYGDGVYFGAPAGQSYFAGETADSMALDATDAGYWILATNANIYAYGDAPYLGGGL